ncbi:uncharacterized protein LOC142639959 [Castanea sativa]|uniref:uncharacterized protein LOC142639959 n=1 Tax=Castanea sativa TaxID=21020 RepID=UPI003F650AB1
MNKPEAARRIIQWAIKLTQFNIEYHPRTAIKAQPFADFIAKSTILEEEGVTDDLERWTIQTNSSSIKKRGGVGVIIITLEGETLKYGVQLTFLAPNNEAEYEEVLTGLRVGKALGIKNLLLQSDSKLIVRQINGEFEAKEDKMKQYLRLAKLLTQEFDRVEFTQILRSQNMGADELEKWSSSKVGPSDTNLKIEVQTRPSTEEVPTFAIQIENSWMTPILSFLQDRRLSQDHEEARKVRKRAVRFTILNGTLYKRGFSMPYLKCVNKEEAKYILEEIHEGICGDHAGPRSLISKVIRTGYF